MVKIVVDGMGGDNAPEEVVSGVVDAVNKKEGFQVVLTGDEKRIREELQKYAYEKERIVIVHAGDVITNDDIPTKAIRSKPDSSLVVALNLLKSDPEVGGLVSCGSTGAVLTGGVLKIGRLSGISRPALCPAIPNYRRGVTLLCDCGANVECKPINFVHFAIMATAYAKAAYGNENPKVGLLNNGTEDHKGDPLHQAAHELLKKIDCIHYVGNVEGRDIMYGDVDIVVCDGFSGNIALKSIEGCGKTVKEILTQEFKKNLGRKLSYLVSRASVHGLTETLDYHSHGGAVFLGMKKVIVKGHGSCKAKSITPSVIQAYNAYSGGLTEKISEMLASVNWEEISELGEQNE